METLPHHKHDNAVSLCWVQLDMFGCASELKHKNDKKKIVECSVAYGPIRWWSSQD